MPSDQPAHRYSAALAQEIESRWQSQWDQRATWRQPNPGEPGFDASRPKKFILDMFPYPSGVGLHVGHPIGYIATDIYARYLRMSGHNVLYTMGFDSFGLPAEQYAVQTNTHPRVTTEANIATMRRQLRRLGLSHDPARSVSTTDESFYQWTQWIFLQIYNSWYDPEAPGAQPGTHGRARPIADLVAQFERGERKTTSGKPWSQLSQADRHAHLDQHRLAYLAEVPVNWCPQLGTVLANEEVTADGRSERGNFPVYKRPLKQWMMRITAYADRLLSDLNLVDWPESVKLLQRNWIGKSEGAYVDFACNTRRIRVFTTRPDTLYGATYMVLSPQHPVVDQIVTEKYGDTAFTRASFPGADELLARKATPREMVDAYRAYASGGSALRADASTSASAHDSSEVHDNEKTGVFTGAYALNPINNARIPVFIADYVLMGYGTGAIMAVPAHDERDFEFADVFNLPKIEVVRAAANSTAPGACFSGEGVAVNSPLIDNLPTAEAKRTIAHHLEQQTLGKRATQYKLRDWLFSRQRYWGEPFPIVFDEQGLAHALPESALPLTLPPMENFKPEATDDPDAPPRPPLARAADWARVTLDLHDGRGPRPFTRELNTMPNWAGSCWYYLRYLDPANPHALVAKAVEQYWMAGSLGTPDVPAGGPAIYGIDLPDPVCVRASDFLARNPYPPGTHGRAVDVTLHKRFLPHLDMPGATYFVTWKTLDDRTLSPLERDIAFDALKFFDDKRCRVFAACVMSNHVHWLVKPHDGESLGSIVRSVKEFSARQMNEATGVGGSVWSPEHFDHIVRDAAYFSEFLMYIVRNPVTAKVVARASEYRWSFVHPSVTIQPLSERVDPLADTSGVPGAGGVDLYVGGVEHAVLHLLYARFWHKVLFDLGHVSTPEPFGRLFNQGYIQAAAYTDARGVYVEASQVTEGPEVQIPVGDLESSAGVHQAQVRSTKHYFDGRPVFQEFGKMGKSLRNAVAPDEICTEFGCDTLRVYEMAMGPLEASKPWNTRDIAGSHRFLQRLWRVVVDEETGQARVSDAPLPAPLTRTLHKTILGVRKDMESLGFNTAVSKLIELVNDLTKHVAEHGAVPRAAAEALTLMLAPLAPHMAEELWQRLGHAQSLAREPFPVGDPALAVDDTVEIAVQVAGKIRARINVPAGSDAKTCEDAALAHPEVKPHLEGKTIKKVIVVPSKLVNVVVA